MNTKTRRKKYINPLEVVIDAARETEQLRHQEYSIHLLNRLVEHNRTKLVPALILLMEWAAELQKDTNALNKKLIRQAKTRGKR